MAYISPINVDFITEMVEKLEEKEEAAILHKVNAVIDVDKDELLRALLYDRNQYKKGYEDGKKEVIEFIEKWQDQQTGGEYSFELITDLLEELGGEE